MASIAKCKETATNKTIDIFYRATSWSWTCTSQHQEGNFVYVFSTFLSQAIQSLFNKSFTTVWHVTMSVMTALVA